MYIYTYIHILCTHIHILFIHTYERTYIRTFFRTKTV